MKTPRRPTGMYEGTGHSMPQRLVLAGIAGLWVVLSWDLFVGGGVETLDGWFGWPVPGRTSARAIGLVVGFTIYYVRILFTEFVFLKRGVTWAETLAISIWLLFIFLFLGIAASNNDTPVGASALVAATLFIVGSWMNSYAEYSRHVWKARPENRGRLYVGGLFGYSRHPNYLGDLISFSGLCLFAGRWVTMIVPAFMLGGFVLANIPTLDAHLHEHYGASFDEYAARTRKLIPFVY